LTTGILAIFPSVHAQSAVRDEFPTGKLRGERFEHFTKDQWEASNYAKPEAMRRWQDLRYGMFIHFGITSWAKRDLSWGSIARRYAPDAPSIMANGQPRTEEWTTWGNDMKLEKFNAREWVEFARSAGFKYIVVCTKHHEGFHMWNTAFSDFKITRTPFGRDYIKELVEACHEAKMPIGFYFAQREWYHPDYQPLDLTKVTQNGHHWTLKPGATSPLGPRHAKYLEYLKNAVRELCTKYGKIDIWWWDAVSWNGMFTKEMWDSEAMTRMIRELQPDIVINHLFQLPGCDLVLPAIPDRQVVSANVLADGATVAFKQTPQQLVLSLPPQAAIKGDLVIALTMNQSLDGLPSTSADEVGCSFAVDSATYGSVVSRQAKVKASSTSQWMPADGGASLVTERQPASFAFHTDNEAAPFVDIDLGKSVKVTGVFIRNANPENAGNRMATLRASVSLDGREWTEVWRAATSEPSWEFPITSFVSGARIPGRQARFLRLQVHPTSPGPLLLKQVEVYGK
jgi:hypothetical protein